jgi:hypothetical protein
MARQVARVMANAIAGAMANGWQRRFVRDMAPTPPQYLGGPSAYLTQGLWICFGEGSHHRQVANAREPRQ